MSESAITNLNFQNKKKSKLQSKAPTQERSKQTVNIILESCTALLKEESFFELSTEKISKKAEVSIGSLYQFFGNKESVVSALIQNILKSDKDFFSNELSKYQFQIDSTTKQNNSNETQALTTYNKQLNYLIDVFCDMYTIDFELRRKTLPIQNYLLTTDNQNEFIEFLVHQAMVFFKLDSNTKNHDRIYILISSLNGVLQNKINLNDSSFSSKNFRYSLKDVFKCFFE